jgi:predicted glycosyltransferase
MNFLIQLGHPAHFHLYSNVISVLKSKGHKVSVLIKTKDILEDLLSGTGIEYLNILPEGRKDSKLGLLAGVLKKDWRMYRFTRGKKFDLFTGSSAEIGHIGKLTGVPSIYLGEDDAEIVKTFCRIAFPFFDVIIQPETCNAGKWEAKSIKYAGFQKLAYLHPTHFKPDKNLVNGIDFSRPYFIIRLVSLGAYHDADKKGFSPEVLSRLIRLLEKHGNVYISSEKKLPAGLLKYSLPIDIKNMHHAMFFSDLFIGDSQSMTVEAAILGIPNIRYNDFSGRIGVLEELEHKYGLTQGIRTKDVEVFFAAVQCILENKGARDEYQKRREKMLSEKIDVTSFLVWFFENYPASLSVMKQNPDFQDSFR